MNTTMAAALMTLTLALAGCETRAQDDPRTLPELVRVTTVTTPAGGSESFTGAVTSRVQSDLGFRVSGKVIRRMVDLGQTVVSGQPLMQIDITDYMHAITTQSENVAAARARSDQAAADELRYRGLVRTGAVSASTYDQIKAAADSAQAQLAAAVAQERIARDQGDYSILYADSDGTVVQTLAEPGQVVAAGQTVVKLAHAGAREAAIYLPETVRPVLGSVAQATLYGAVKSAPARLRQLSDSADPATRTFEASLRPRREKRGRTPGGHSDDPAASAEYGGLAGGSQCGDHRPGQRAWRLDCRRGQPRRNIPAGYHPPPR
jgi:RND family efflux transporter MFP subunit